MIDFGLDKIALIGAVALVVIGPEKLPKVARIVGHLIGKAQRYVADVKAEVNRSMELDELRGMKTQFETAARDLHTTVHRELGAARRGVQGQWQQAQDALSPPVASPGAAAGAEASVAPSGANDASGSSTPPAMRPLGLGAVSAVSDSRRPRKNWRIKRAAVPAWYKQREGLRTHAQSGAARVARFRPPRGVG